MRALLVCVVVACGTKDSPPAAGSAPAPEPVKPVPEPVDAAPPAPDASPLGDLPALSLADVDKAAMEKSFKLNNAGVAAHTKKDWKTATLKYTEALRDDPGNLLARYNLASAYSSSGDDAKAFALLAQLKLPDCRACVGILLHATTDAEWKDRAGDARFKAIVDGVTAPAPTDVKKLAQRVIAAVRTGKTEGLEDYVHPRGPITITELAYSPEPAKPTYVYGWKGFVAWIGKGQKLEDNGVRACTRTCCKTGQRGDSSDVIDEICFATTGGVTFITSIKLDYGPI